MRVVGFLLLWSWVAAGLAQATQPTPTMYKCLDDRRQVTYSNIACEKQGLRDGGPVADRTTSIPFTEPPKAVPSKPTATPPPPAEPAKGPSETPKK